MADALQYKEERLFTYADYKSWELKEGERYELIYGDAYAMSSPTIQHQEISGEIFRQIANFLHGKSCKAYSAPLDVRLFYEENETDDTVVQPDITVVCDETKRGAEGCRGAPDMTVEVLSPSNTVFEMERKLTLYEKAKVREYWVVDPKNKHIRAYRLAEDRFVMQNYYEQDTAASEVLPGLKIALEELFAPES
jgi:Uma2 family endonuclease